jgi:hypothetical protein
MNNAVGGDVNIGFNVFDPGCQCILEGNHCVFRPQLPTATVRNDNRWTPEKWVEHPDKVVGPVK